MMSPPSGPKMLLSCAVLCERRASTSDVAACSGESNTCTDGAGGVVAGGGLDEVHPRVRPARPMTIKHLRRNLRTIFAPVELVSVGPHDRRRHGCRRHEAPTCRLRNILHCGSSGRGCWPR